MSILSLPEFNDHESVTFSYDPRTGLKNFIAIHNTTCGPAIGGTRCWEYDSEEEGLRDALRLSRAMTYKCAIVGLPFGGGKSVIVLSKGQKKDSQLLKKYSAVLNSFGRIFTGEDVGLVQDDIEIMAAESKYIIGSKKKAGEPGPWAGKSVFYAMRAALKAVYGDAKYAGRTIAIKGLGNVGMELCRLVNEEGGAVIAADIDERKVSAAQERFPGIKIVSAQEIDAVKTDVYSPCALGGEFTEETISRLHCSIVCGAANNQLARPEAGMLFHQKGIVYVPDYLANAGGLINVAAELAKGGYDPEAVGSKVREIESIAAQVIATSEKENIPTYQVADRIAERSFHKKD